MPPFCHDILLTQRLLYVTDVHQKSLSIISCHFSDVCVGGDTKFNRESLIGRFSFTRHNEVIDKVYRVTDFEVTPSRKTNEGNENQYGLPRRVEDLKIDLPLMDTCIIVTNFAAYRVVIRFTLRIFNS